MPLLFSSLLIVFTWALVAVVLIGIGSLVLRTTLKNFLALDAIWVGLGVSVVILQMWSFLLPVGLATVGLLISVGVVGLVLNWTWLASQISDGLKSKKTIALTFAVILFFLAVRASGPCDYYDTGLYGISAVRWIVTYRVVPGLANLHGRLGFNSSVFLCIAALSQGVWKNLGFHLFTGFILALMWLHVLPAVFRIGGKTTKSPVDWFNFIVTIPLCMISARSSIVGTQTDEPATVVCLVGASLLFGQFCQKRPEPGSSSYDRSIVAIVLFALAVTIKLSTILFSSIAGCLLIVNLFQQSQTRPPNSASPAMAFILSACILLPWAVRGIILSGYPFYPAPIFGFPFDWKSPSAMTEHVAATVKAWGRIPDVPAMQTEGYAWIEHWIHFAVRNRSAFQVPILISIIALATVLFLRVREGRRSSPKWLWLLLPSSIAILFWFTASPDLRFVQFAIWTLAGTLGAWAIELISSAASEKRFHFKIAGALVGLLIWCLVSFGWRASFDRFLHSPPLASVPEARVVQRPTHSGLIINVPVSGNQCWDAPIPCTPYFNESLRLRRADTASGFLSAGGIVDFD